MNYSLLDGSVITVRYRNGKTSTTNLPQIFCGLLNDTIVSFEALQPHQQQAWYSFLVQLSAIAVARENNGDIPTTPDEWRKLLLQLGDDSEAAWHLVVDDVSQPAFMQPPVPEGSLEEAKYSSDIQTPDELDMLVTSANHDLKGKRILRPDPEHWLFALLTLQTMEGYSGPKNYGIARMNGGSGNRPLVGMYSKIDWSKRFKRDVNVLLENRTKLMDLYNSNGQTLLWLIEWNGKKDSAIPLSDCDPFFIEICRRIRFIKSGESIKCFRNTSDSPRILSPKNLKGITNDPWTPVRKKDAKTLTIGDQNGFTYDRIQELILGNNFKKPIALEFYDEKNGAFFLARCMVRGQGKTYGLHKRIIPITSGVVKILQTKSDKEIFAKRAHERVELASKVQTQILKPSLKILMSNGENQKVEPKKIRVWTNRFDQEIDRRFFESLWASVEMEQEEAVRQWEKILLEVAEKLFKEAERSTSIAQLRRLRAVSNARSKFDFQSHNLFQYAGKQETVTQ
jgi:CRISPR system Cascade subunit CasA